MIVRKEDDGWIVFLADDGDTEMWRVRPPREGFTLAELEQFREHLIGLAKKHEVGPS